MSFTRFTQSTLDDLCANGCLPPLGVAAIRETLKDKTQGILIAGPAWSGKTTLFAAIEKEADHLTSLPQLKYHTVDSLYNLTKQNVPLLSTIDVTPTSPQDVFNKIVMVWQALYPHTTPIVHRHIVNTYGLLLVTSTSKPASMPLKVVSVHRISDNMKTDGSIETHTLWMEPPHTATPTPPPPPPPPSDMI